MLIIAGVVFIAVAAVVYFMDLNWVGALVLAAIGVGLLLTGLRSSHR